jgi:hypothetical protein
MFAWNSVACSADGSKIAAAAWTDGSVSYNPSLIYISTNSGTTWTQTSAPSNFWWSVASSADGTKLVAGSYNSRSFFTSFDSGANWTSNNLPGGPIGSRVAIVSSADGTRLMAACNSQYVFISTNSGSNWISKFIFVPNHPSANWSALTSSADGRRLAAISQDAPVYTSTDFGNTWTPDDVTNAPWTAIASSADGNRLVAVAQGTILGNIYTSYSTAAPQLNLAITSSNLAFSWTVPSTNFVLQQNLDLMASDWVTLTNTPTLNLTNLNNEISLFPTNTSSFFRLATP